MEGLVFGVALAVAAWLWLGQSNSGAASAVAAGAPVAPVIPCKTCDKGQLARERCYRMSQPVVVIGWILLVPSIIGMTSSGCMCLATGRTTTMTRSHSEDRTRQMLVEAGVPPELGQHVLSGQAVSDEEMNRLNWKQREAVRSARMALLEATAGTGLAAGFLGGMAIVGFIGSLVGGLLGWLLVMKKDLLRCNVCGAVIAAS